MINKKLFFFTLIIGFATLITFADAGCKYQDSDSGCGAGVSGIGCSADCPGGYTECSRCYGCCGFLSAGCKLFCRACCTGYADNVCGGCNAIYGWCGELGITNGNINYSNGNRYIDTTASFACNNGYVISATTTTTCLASRTWSAYTNPTCNARLSYCTPPAAPASGSYSVSNTNYIIGTAITYACNTGYSTTNSLTGTCVASTATNGLWSISTPTCNAVFNYCPDVSAPSFGTKSYSNTGRYITNTVTWTCNFGYAISVGVSLSTCSAGANSNAGSGVWSPSGSPPTCTKITNYCPDITAPDFGDKVYSDGFKLDSTATWRCNAGYQQPGGVNKVATCIASTALNGVWSPNANTPVCSKIPNFCPAPVNPTGGSFTCSDSTHTVQTSCTLNCNSGYIRVAPVSSTCQTTATYTAVGTCNACAAGSFCDGVTTTQCAPGKFQDLTAQSTCLNCPQFSDSVQGSSQCTCIAGYAPQNPVYTPRTLVCVPTGTIFFTPGNTTFYDRMGSTITVSVSTNAAIPSSATLTVDGSSTAVLGTDFTLSTTSLSFTANGRSTFTVSLLSVANAPIRTAVLRLTNLNGVAASQFMNTTITIDAGGFAAGTFRIIAADRAVKRVDENVGSVTIGVERLDSSVGPVTATFSFASSLSGTSQDLTQRTISFTDGQTVGTLTYPIVDDNTPELDETLSLTLSSVSAGIVSSLNKASIIINENDDARGVFEFTALTGSVVEGTITDPATVSYNCTVFRNRGLFGTVSVQVSTLAGTAGTPQDFVPFTTPLTFTEGQAYNWVILTVNNDDVPEIDETLTLQLQVPTGGARIESTKNTSVITILENDDARGIFNFDSTTVTTQEVEGGQILNLGVTRSRGLFGSVSLSYSTASGTATAGFDFQSVSGSVVTFGPNQAYANLQILVLDDAIPEDDEWFTVGLSGFTGGSKGGPSLTTNITIRFNDDAFGVFSIASFHPFETPQIVSGGDTYNVTVTRTVGLFRSVKLRLNVVPLGPTTPNLLPLSNAVRASDFVFAAGQTTATLTVTSIVSAASNPLQPYYLELVIDPVTGSPVNTSARVAVGASRSYYQTLPASPTGGVFNIPDTFAEIGNRGDGYMLVPITRTSAASAATVSFILLSDTAVFDIDFSYNSSDTLSFAVGETTQFINVTLADDGEPHLPSRFGIELTGATGGVLGLATIGYVSIGEYLNPSGTFQFSYYKYIINEDAGSLILPLERTGGTLVGVSVTATIESVTDLTEAQAILGTSSQLIRAVNGANYDLGSSVLDVTMPVADNFTNAISIKIRKDGVVNTGMLVFRVNISSVSSGSINSNNRTVLVGVQNTDTSSDALVVGVAAGVPIGIIFILLVIVLLLVVARRSRRQKKRPTELGALAARESVTEVTINPMCAANSDYDNLQRPRLATYDNLGAGAGAGGHNEPTYANLGSLGLAAAASSSSSGNDTYDNIRAPTQESIYESSYDKLGADAAALKQKEYEAMGGGATYATTEPEYSSGSHHYASGDESGVVVASYSQPPPQYSSTEGTDSTYENLNITRNNYAAIMNTAENQN